MQRIIDGLCTHRIVSVIGPPGIGKTSTVRNIANYLKDRMKFKHGIIFIKLQGCETAEMFFRNFAVRLISAKVEGTDKGSHFDHFNSGLANDQSNDLELEKHLQKYKNMEVLLVIDNVEDLLEKAENQFIHNLIQILDYCQNFKILI